MEEKVAATSLAIFSPPSPSNNRFFSQSCCQRWRDQLEITPRERDTGQSGWASIFRTDEVARARGAATPSPLIAAQSFDRKLSRNAAFPNFSRFNRLDPFSLTISLLQAARVIEHLSLEIIDFFFQQFRGVNDLSRTHFCERSRA